MLKKIKSADKYNENSLFNLQEKIYKSNNFTRRRLHNTRFKWVQEAIIKYSKLNDSFSNSIEYGPGSGIYLPLLASKFDKVVAADIEDAYLKGIKPLLNKFDNLTLLLDDVQHSTLENCSFDLVLCSEVIEHIPNPEASLETISRILKPGGIAILTTPQKWSAMELACKVAFLPGFIHLVKLIYREPVMKTGHISLRTSNQISEAIKKNDFEIIESSKFGLYIPFLAEFGGGEIILKLEKYIGGKGILWPLWTQAYVLKKKFN